MHHLDGGRKGAVRRRRDTVHPDQHAACGGDFGRHFRAGQYPAVARLGTLAEFDFHHLDLGVARVGAEFVGIEAAVVVTAAKISRADFPDQVAPILAVMHRNRPLAGVVCKTTAFGARVERQNRVRAQGTETHGRNIQYAGVVGLGAEPADGGLQGDLIGRAADPDPEVVRGNGAGHHRMVHPLVTFRVHVELGAERPFVGVPLGALVDQRTLRARERRGLVVAFQEVLPQFGANELEHKAQVPDDRIVAQDRAFGLRQVVQAQAHENHEHRHPPATLAKPHQREDTQHQAHGAQAKNGVTDREKIVQTLQHG